MMWLDHKRVPCNEMMKRKKVQYPKQELDIQTLEYGHFRASLGVTTARIH